MGDNDPIIILIMRHNSPIIIIIITIDELTRKNCFMMIMIRSSYTS